MSATNAYLAFEGSQQYFGNSEWYPFRRIPRRYRQISSNRFNRNWN